MGKDGGTKFWCDQCNCIRPFAVISDLLLRPHNGLYEADGIPFRRRRRHCTECNSEIFTAEIEEDYLDEFIALRKKLLDLQLVLDEEVLKIKMSQERQQVRLYSKAEALIQKLYPGKDS